LLCEDLMPEPTREDRRVEHALLPWLWIAPLLVAIAFAVGFVALRSFSATFYLLAAALGISGVGAWWTVRVARRRQSPQ
jgi:hypothetical protein